jgi:hypothetical protein
MSAERDKVAVDWDAIPAYLVAHVATAIASARRLGAEEMRERCASLVRAQLRYEPRMGAEPVCRNGAEAQVIVKRIESEIRSLPLPPEVGA